MYNREKDIDEIFLDLKKENAEMDYDLVYKVLETERKNSRLFLEKGLGGNDV